MTSSASSSDRGFGSSIGKNPQVQQLFVRLSQEINEKQPANPVFFICDFLCKHYPHLLPGFSSIWNGDPELEKDRLQVVEFFRFQKLPTEIASHFTNAGFDTLETLCTLTVENLDEIERFNQTRWLPGHKVRLQQSFSDIAGRVRAFRQEREKMLHIARVTTGHCDHPAVLTRTNMPPGQALPAITSGPSPIPKVNVLAPSQQDTRLTAPPMAGVTMSTTGTSRPLFVNPM
ncbi:MAG: hypothetical protein KVP17_002886 [Porospora cf. gigantea B]|uniref:uncharacterized protein n=1 Tax=Porospora cf. gigantea B TaxID=2853592 RepID=UPI00357198B1|nr:MAG: hypothetical protein KVP17_002886 [Porospora cf. gigantea B]